MNHIARFATFLNENTNLLAPNGAPSNLNPVQYRLVRSDAFKNWFGDWENDPENSSKVIDENGEPLVVYHGTSKKFNRFNWKKSAQGVFWFTSEKDKIMRGESGASGTSVIMSFFIKAKQVAGWKEYEKLGLGQIRERGFGAIKLDDDFVAFEPNDIKSAEGKNLTFDSENKNSRF